MRYFGWNIIQYTDIRTQSIGLVLASFCASAAVNVKSFPQLKNSFGLHGIFFFYGAIGFFYLSWGLKTIPDNRGKSLVKVEEMYEKKNEQDTHSWKEMKKYSQTWF